MAFWMCNCKSPVAGFLTMLLTLGVRAQPGQAGPSYESPSDEKALLGIELTNEITMEAWQALLDELSELARPPDSATFDGMGKVNLTNLNFDDVGLTIAEEIVQRLEQHWKTGREQKQAANTGVPPDPLPGDGNRPLNPTTMARKEDSTPAPSTAFETATAAPDGFDDGDGDSKRASAQANTYIDAFAAIGRNADSGRGSVENSNTTSSGSLNSSSCGEGGDCSRRGRSLLQGGGEAGTGSPMYANAFRLVFGNFFDFVEGARRFIATLAAEANTLLINVDWIRDLAILATAPLDNIINSNWLPLPQSINQLRTLLQTALNSYCIPESLRQSQLILGDFQGPTVSLAITPASCPVKVDMKTGRRSIDWENCTPAQLQVAITPATYTGARYTAPVYTGKYCRYTRAFGTDKTYSVGGGSNSYTFRRSARQLDIIPVLNQFFVRGLFSPFVADNLRFGNVTGGPIFEAISISAPTTVNGSNTAFILRSAAESAKAEAYLNGKIIAVQDDAPVQYVPAWQPRQRNESAGAAGAATSSGAATAVPPVSEPVLEGPQPQLQPPQQQTPTATEDVSTADRQSNNTPNTSVQAVVPYHGKQVSEQMPVPVQSSQNTARSVTDMPSAGGGADAAELADSHRTVSSPVDTSQSEEQQVLPYKPKVGQATLAALQDFDKAAPSALGPPSPDLSVTGDHNFGGGGDYGIDARAKYAPPGAMQGREHLPVTARWNRTYSDWLLGVVDQEFGTAGG